MKKRMWFTQFGVNDLKLTKTAQIRREERRKIKFCFVTNHRHRAQVGTQFSTKHSIVLLVGWLEQEEPLDQPIKPSI
jgi:hypothetical protein